MFLSDFSVNHPLEGNGRRFYMTSSEGGASSGTTSSLSSSGNSGNMPRSSSKSAFQRVKLWAANESKTRQVMSEPMERNLVWL